MTPRCIIAAAGCRSSCRNGECPFTHPRQRGTTQDLPLAAIKPCSYYFRVLAVEFAGNCPLGPITPTEAALLWESSMANSAELSFERTQQTRGGIKSPQRSLDHINDLGLNVRGQSRISKRRRHAHRLGACSGGASGALIAADPSIPVHLVRPVEERGFHPRKTAGRQPQTVASADRLIRVIASYFATDHALLIAALVVILLIVMR